MRFIIKMTLAFLSALWVLPTGLHAEESTPPQGEQSSRESLKQKWQSLSPEERQQKKEKWQSLSPEERQQKKEKWQSLSPEEQGAAKQRFQQK